MFAYLHWRHVSVFIACLLLGSIGTLLVRASLPAPPPHTAQSPVGDAAMDEPEPAPPATPQVAGALSEPQGVVDLLNPICPIMENDVIEYETCWITYNGLRVYFCCFPCYEDFLAQPLKNLQLLAREYKVKVPAWALREEAHPPVVQLKNENSPVSSKPTRRQGQTDVIVVHRGIAVWLADQAEIAVFLADPRRYLTALGEQGLEVPMERLQ